MLKKIRPNPKYLPQPLSQDDICKLLVSNKSYTWTGVRDRAIVAVLYRTGVRRAELTTFSLQDVDAINQTIRVIGKRRKVRIVGMDNMGWMYFKDWLELRKEMAVPVTVPVFCTRRGKEMHETYLNCLLSRMAKKAGVTSRVHPHSFRHTHAMELANEGVPMHIIQKQLGHASLDTTSVYLNHLTGSDLAQAMQARKWPGQIKIASQLLSEEQIIAEQNFVPFAAPFDD
jgi:site-specific recombinase XerD